MVRDVPYGMPGVAATAFPCNFDSVRLTRVDLPSLFIILLESPRNSERFPTTKQQEIPYYENREYFSLIRVSIFDADSGPARASASAHISNIETPIGEHVHYHV